MTLTTDTKNALPSERREFEYTLKDFEKVRDLVYQNAGITLQSSKTNLVYSRLSKRLRACGMQRFKDYLTYLDGNEEERTRAVTSLTTNHTSFFREKHHFDHLVNEVWPALKKKLESGGRVRIWSAGCSSGEEPYTLAMALAGTDRNLPRWLLKHDFRILASDLAPHVLATARAGRYPNSIAESIPASLRNLWMTADGDSMVVNPICQQLIAFRELNLLGTWPMRHQFDVIFCRNVMIYFDEPTKSTLFQNFSKKLVTGGYLYIGHSERLVGKASQDFVSKGQTIYQKRSM
ncbi:MAG: protein-glutamate O-methyltransferase CheR [Zymomonas mobilis]|uniref:CheR family methyltransferase n=1 Tax=Zymomonas mobilis TaxID=542 RepID=UPI0039ED26B4